MGIENIGIEGSFEKPENKKVQEVADAINFRVEEKLAFATGGSAKKQEDSTGKIANAIEMVISEEMTKRDIQIPAEIECILEKIKVPESVQEIFEKVKDKMLEDFRIQGLL